MRTGRLAHVLELSLAVITKQKVRLLVPDIVIEWAEDAEGIALTLLALALVLGLVNTFIRPIARLVSLPLNILSLGLFSVVLNAALLLAILVYLLNRATPLPRALRW